MTAEPAKWKEALKFGVREVRRLGMFGLTSGELNRFSSALLTDARQLAAQGNKISNGERYPVFFFFFAYFRFFVSLKSGLIRLI